jgi:hypothetical protein
MRWQNVFLSLCQMQCKHNVLIPTLVSRQMGLSAKIAVQIILVFEACKALCLEEKISRETSAHRPLICTP